MFKVKVCVLLRFHVLPYNPAPLFAVNQSSNREVWLHSLTKSRVTGLSVKLAVMHVSSRIEPTVGLSPEMET